MPLTRRTASRTLRLNNKLAQHIIVGRRTHGNMLRDERNKRRRGQSYARVVGNHLSADGEDGHQHQGAQQNREKPQIVQVVLLAGDRLHDYPAQQIVEGGLV